MDDESPLLGRGVLESVAALPADAKAAVLIRHSTRGELVAPQDDVPLTPEGILAARRFGRQLRWPLSIAARSSPRLRCRQSAEEILSGFSETHPGTQNSYLGSADSLSAIIHGVSDHSLLQQLFDGIQAGGGRDGRFRVPPPVVASSDRVARESLARIAQLLRDSRSETLHVFVDHDLHLIILREYIFGGRYRTTEWVDFLDGLVLSLTGESLSVRMQGRTATYGLRDGLNEGTDGPS
ncbi:MAG: histidine phosphatase family protein [Nitrososphaerota archaeon]|nr:histidine phosphatase family protein [Nitrososphaerota archaeon]